MDRRSTGALMGTLITTLKQISLLWLKGFREACCFHRVITYCLRSGELAIRTGQCFLLNGFFFLGSIFILRSFIIPTIQWILTDGCPYITPQESFSFGGISRFYSFLRSGLVQLFYDFLTNASSLLSCLLGFSSLFFWLLSTVLFSCASEQVFWFYPLYIFSFILNTIWYNDIAKYGFFAIEKGYSGTKSSSQNNLPAEQNTTDRDGKATDFEGVMIGIAEQVYSILLLSFFFLEVYVTGFIPYVGKALNFLLLSWMYAYYCFEYKWNFSGLSLDERLDFFESNWPFFAGFGGPCVLATFFYSPLVSYGVMAILYPLFVMTATGTEANKVITSQRKKWRGAGLSRIPIFVSANYLSMKVLLLFPIDARRQQVQCTKAL